MSAIVVAKWILPEPDSTQADRLIVEAVLKGDRLVVLDLAIVEVTNAIWKRYHRGLATLDEARTFLTKLVQSADEPLYNVIHADFPRIVLLRNW